MKNPNGFARPRRGRTSPARRAQLLAAFERSGLSAADFARQQGLGYTTFCQWRQHRTKPPPGPTFVEVQLPEPAAPVEVWVEVGAYARLCLTSAAQLELAARLLHHLDTLPSC
jgi:hypothetical protein